MLRTSAILLAACLFSPPLARAANFRPTTRPTPFPTTLPHLQVDTKRKLVRMHCQAVNAPSPLEFFVCVAGGPEHETVLRSRAKASHLHLALLMLGLEPGEPFHIAQPANKRIAPTGPLLRITCEFTKDGKTVRVPPHRLMRNLKTRRPLDPLTFVFAGSRLTPDGRYAADVNGHLISVVNFEYTVIDLPDLRSNTNESLEWEIDPDVLPSRDTPVDLIIEPVDPKTPVGK